MAESTESKDKASSKSNKPEKSKKSLAFSRPVLKSRINSDSLESKKKHKKNFEDSPYDFSQSSNRSSIQDSPLNPFNILDNFDTPKRKSNPNKNQEFDVTEEQTPSLFSQMIIDSSIGSISSHQLSRTPLNLNKAENVLSSQIESNLKSHSSKHLKGMDVSLNEADREFIIYKESKETFISLRDQLNIIEKDIKDLNFKLKSQEATYKYKLEEGELMNEDFTSFKQKLFDLPLNLFPKKFATSLSSHSLRPEDVLTHELTIENAIDSYINKLRQLNSVEKPSVVPDSNKVLQSKTPLNVTAKYTEKPSLKFISLKKSFSRNNSSRADSISTSIEVEKSIIHNELNASPNTTTAESITGTSSDLITKFSDDETRFQLFQRRQALLKSSRSRLERLLGA